MKRHAVIVSLVLLAGCATQAPYQHPFPSTTPSSFAPPAPFDVPRTISHEVGPGETLWRISKTYGVSIEALMRANNISNASQINNGQTVIVPDTRGPRATVPLFPSLRWTHIVIHHTATEAGNARSIDQLHHKRGWEGGLGYHFLVDNGTNGKMDGQIEVGPRWVKQKHGAHANANGMNDHGIGISLVGNYSESRVSQRQLSNLVYLVKTLQSYYNISTDRVIRHGDVPGKNTECPGLNFPWPEFKSRLA
ncbi:MAG: N-acetylmuramoyl-L-alanine amidase [Candidatus Omnitrophota bacterium]|nr:N-acetylmuramoyl-L-alanine amidase [Candidatus Omnitrophota bacterium]